MSTSSEKKAFIVRSCEGWKLWADEALMAESGLIRSHLHNNANSDDDRILSLPNVDFHTLFLVVQFCKNRLNSNAPESDSEFIANPAHTRQTIEKLMLAAETLQIPSLLDLTRNRIQELNAQVAQVQNAAGNNLEIDQDVEIVTHALRDTVLAIFATRANNRDALERLMHAAETLQIPSLLDLTRTRIAKLDSARPSRKDGKRSGKSRKE